MKTCIFDLDGTLTDTLESITYSVQETLKEMGLMPITKEQCCAFVGNGARVLIEKSWMRAEIRRLPVSKREWKCTDVYLMRTVHIM